MPANGHGVERHAAAALGYQRPGYEGQTLQFERQLLDIEPRCHQDLQLVNGRGWGLPHFLCLAAVTRGRRLRRVCSARGGRSHRHAARVCPLLGVCRRGHAEPADGLLLHRGRWGPQLRRLLLVQGLLLVRWRRLRWLTTGREALDHATQRTHELHEERALPLIMGSDTTQSQEAELAGQSRRPSSRHVKMSEAAVNSPGLTGGDCVGDGVNDVPGQVRVLRGGIQARQHLEQGHAEGVDFAAFGEAARALVDGALVTRGAADRLHGDMQEARLA
mmetsp:Transcript_88261/g.189458  ORF Transcript_88261/g.189458 Transcript_88261/m.189458 type:complete len:275 (+) Transcript_88261:1993-2817(+)